MTIAGFYQRVYKGELKTTRNARFESTGVKNEYGKAIWRKINKDGTPSNVFAEQFHPDTPWAVGKWFCKIDGGCVLEKHPELKVETERTAQMTHEEYCEYLHSTYEG